MRTGETSRDVSRRGWNQSREAEKSGLDRTQFHSYSETVKNITVSVDEQIYHAARVEAARRQTSLSACVREYLEKFARGESSGGEKASESGELVDLLEQCNLSLSESPSREETYADRRFH